MASENVSKGWSSIKVLTFESLSNLFTQLLAKSCDSTMCSTFVVILLKSNVLCLSLSLPVFVFLIRSCCRNAESQKRWDKIRRCTQTTVKRKIHFTSVYSSYNFSISCEWTRSILDCFLPAALLRKCVAIKKSYLWCIEYIAEICFGWVPVTVWAPTHACFGFVHIHPTCGRQNKIPVFSSTIHLEAVNIGLNMLFLEYHNFFFNTLVIMWGCIHLGWVIKLLLFIYFFLKGHYMRPWSVACHLFPDSFFSTLLTGFYQRAALQDKGSTQNVRFSEEIIIGQIKNWDNPWAPSPLPVC